MLIKSTIFLFSLLFSLLTGSENLITIHVQPKLETQECKEEFRGEYLPKNITKASINNFSNHIEEAYKSLDPNSNHFEFPLDLSALTLSYLDSFEQVSVLEGHTDTIHSVKWSEDGNQLISVSKDNTIRTWDIETGYQTDLKYVKFTLDLLAPNLKYYTLCDWSHKGNNSKFSRMIIEDLNQKLRTFTYLRECIAYNKKYFSPDSCRLAMVLDNNDIVVWNDCNKNNATEIKLLFGGAIPFKWATAKLIRLVSSQNNNDIVNIIWSPDSKYISAITKSGVATIWDIKNKTNILLDDLVDTLAWSPDGQFIALGLQDKTLKIIDAFSGRDVQRFDHNFNYNIKDISWSGDNKYIATSSNVSIDIFNVHIGQKVYHDSSWSRIWNTKGLNVAWSPCNKYFAVYGPAGKLVLIYRKTIR